jgi:penicillin-binding protein 1C
MKLRRRLFIAGLLCFVGILLSCGMFYFGVSPSYVRSFTEIRDSYKKSEACLLDRHGEVIQELRVDFEGRRLEWTELKDISPALIKAVIQSEDRRFYKHRGVDWIAIASAVVKDIVHGQKRGASTITMQLASTLNRELRPKAQKRNIDLKIRQMRTALWIEQTWKKAEILEAYLNIVTFRGELRGITAASRGLFGKEPSGLNEPESMVLACLIRSPNAPVTQVIRRAHALSIATAGNINENEIEEAANRSITAPYVIKRDANLAFQAASMLLSKDHPKIRSSLDAGLQRFASMVLQQYVNSLKGQNVNDGAVLVVHNKTGEVLAYVANSGANSSSAYIDGIQAKRQAGSTLKPFLYGLAFEKRILTPASLISDEPLDFSTKRGLYSPENYDNHFRGLVAARIALASSINIPAVRTDILVGNDLFVRKLEEFGFKDLRDADFYGPAIALGTADVSLWNLVGAYRALALGGKWGELTMLPGKGRPTGRALSEEAAFLVSDILSDREARSTTFGLENPLSTQFWSAVKTGTSKDMRDNWCIGYSSEFTVGVWVGNFGGQPMWNVSGVSGAAPVWLEIMNYIHRTIKSNGPFPPANVLRQQIATSNGPFSEWFIKGTEPVDAPNSAPVETASKMLKPDPKILYPSEGMFIALDPDIPSNMQKVFFEASVMEDWILDGQRLANGKMVPWVPAKGYHELAIAEGTKILDKVSFEVR